MGYYSIIKKNEVQIRSTAWISLGNNMFAKGKEPETKGHIVHDFIYIKCPEQINSLRQKVDQWLLSNERGRVGREY